MMNGCTRTIVAMKARLRATGSCSRWFWLAMIMSGSSQQDSTRRGDEIWSIEVHWVSPLLG